MDTFPGCGMIVLLMHFLFYIIYGLLCITSNPPLEWDGKWGRRENNGREAVGNGKVMWKCCLGTSTSWQPNTSLFFPTPSPFELYLFLLMHFFLKNQCIEYLRYAKRIKNNSRQNRGLFIHPYINWATITKWYQSDIQRGYKNITRGSENEDPPKVLTVYFLVG